MNRTQIIEDVVAGQLKPAKELPTITIGDTIEDDESVGDLDPATVPTGVIVQAGDEVIQVVNP